MSRKKLLSAVTLGIVALLILFAWGPWGSFRYRGDGQFFNRGFFSNPRYVARFSDISLNKVTENYFHFRGLPNEEVTLVLYVKDRSVWTWEERKPLEHLKTTIEASLITDQGKEACHASGKPDSGNRDGIWVLMSGGKSGYWHWQCNHIRVYPNVAYTLTVRVTGADATGEKVVVSPRLEGGGLDLP